TCSVVRRLLTVGKFLYSLSHSKSEICFHKPSLFFLQLHIYVRKIIRQRTLCTVIAIRNYGLSCNPNLLLPTEAHCYKQFAVLLTCLFAICSTGALTELICCGANYSLGGRRCCRTGGIALHAVGTCREIVPPGLRVRAQMINSRNRFPGLWLIDMIFFAG